jgi:hypothetical protein
MGPSSPASPASMTAASATATSGRAETLGPGSDRPFLRTCETTTGTLTGRRRRAIGALPAHASDRSQTSAPSPTLTSCDDHGARPAVTSEACFKGRRGTSTRPSQAALSRETHPAAIDPTSILLPRRHASCPRDSPGGFRY